MSTEEQQVQVPKVFRTMLPDGQRPLIGTGKNMLGARVGIDIKPDPNGCVSRGKGMSVFRTVEEMYPFLIPLCYVDRYPEASGDDSAGKLWVLGVGPFVAAPVTNDLALLPGSGKKAAHGEIEPSRMMSVDVYQSALAATQNDWTEL
jgi:hypothetical protein